jgi:hypothetical protein
MSTKAITPRLADRLCSLAESQLQTQISRSGALDASALGVMAIDAAVAATIFATRGTFDLWIVAPALLGYHSAWLCESCWAQEPNRTAHSLRKCLMPVPGMTMRSSKRGYSKSWREKHC